MALEHRHDPGLEGVQPAGAFGSSALLISGLMDPFLDRFEVQAQLGGVPNFLKVLAHSPAALGSFLGMHAAVENAESGALDAATRERIALAVAESNACEYCVSAHSAIGRKAGLDAAEMKLNREGSSSDAKAAAAVAFARALNENRGEITAAELEAVRAAGHGDKEIVEIIALVAMNFFTNVIGKATSVDIDFPKVALMGKTGHACAAC